MMTSGSAARTLFLKICFRAPVLSSCHFSFCHFSFCHFSFCHFSFCHFSFCHFSFCHFSFCHFSFCLSVFFCSVFFVVLSFSLILFCLFFAVLSFSLLLFRLFSFRLLPSCFFSLPFRSSFRSSDPALFTHDVRPLIGNPLYLMRIVNSLCPSHKTRIHGSSAHLCRISDDRDGYPENRTRLKKTERATHRYQRISSYN